jgi:hypothetical protein
MGIHYCLGPRSRALKPKSPSMRSWIAMHLSSLESRRQYGRL